MDRLVVNIRWQNSRWVDGLACEFDDFSEEVRVGTVSLGIYSLSASVSDCDVVFCEPEQVHAVSLDLKTQGVWNSVVPLHSFDEFWSVVQALAQTVHAPHGLSADLLQLHATQVAQSLFGPQTRHMLSTYSSLHEIPLSVLNALL